MRTSVELRAVIFGTTGLSGDLTPENKEGLLRTGRLGRGGGGGGDGSHFRFLAP